MDIKELLVKRMSEKSPILLLGAGFSKGSVNGLGQPLPDSMSLSSLLCNRFLSDPSMSIDTKEAISDGFKKTPGLRDFCSLLGNLGLLNQRNRVLSEVFSGCKLSSPQSYQNLLCRYRWKKIFSLNIDDLVENIYKSNSNTPLEVWTEGAKYPVDDARVLLVKLHGNAKKPEMGVVFDNEEYLRFVSKPNAALDDFGREFITNDVIMIGTEYSEFDLQLINMYKKNAGYSTSGNHYFVISPTINSPSFKAFLEKNQDQWHWIQWKTEEFFQEISQIVIESKTIKNKLEDFGTVFLDSKAKASLSEFFSSELYKGGKPLYSEFFHDMDVVFPDTKGVIEGIWSSYKSCVIVVHGKSYVGKTVVARRLLVDFFLKGFFSFEIIRNFSDLSRLVVELLSSQPNGSRVAILLEESAFFLHDVGRVMQSIPRNLAQLDFIVVDETQTILSKIHDLDTIDHKMIYVDEKISYEYAKNIYEKLNEKDRLGKFLDLIPEGGNPSTNKNAGKICKGIKQINDIIDVLFYSSEGKGFSDHYKEFFLTKSFGIYKEYLKILCNLGELGIFSVTPSIVPSLLPQYSSNYSLNDFLETFPDLVEFGEDGKVHLQRSRVIFSALGPCSTEVLFQALFQIGCNLGPHVVREENTDEYILFQKALRVKRIRKANLLSITDLFRLFSSLEKHCKDISYFWIQFGIASQQSQKFSDAETHFRNAKRIRPYSYQVKHALAKNLMERGLYELKAKDPISAKHFEDGSRQMKEMIESDEYSHAFRFSLHSYVDLKLKFLIETRQILDSIEAEFIYLKMVKLLSEGNIDSYVRSQIDKFSEYCHQNHLDKYAYFPNLPKRDQIDNIFEDGDYDDFSTFPIP